MHANLSHANSIILIGPRARIPISLRNFLKNTCCEYIDECNNGDV